jgi:hypothetical protein
MIAPKIDGSMIILPITLALLIGGMAVLFAGIIHDMKSSAVGVDKGFLVVKAFIYGKKIPVKEIDINNARQLNLLEDKDYSLTIRTNGVGLPGYRSGWMRLRNGREAFVHLTDKTKVALLPTEKYDILLSVADFEGLKNALERSAGE